jgi:hypothetical protein
MWPPMSKILSCLPRNVVQRSPRFIIVNLDIGELLNFFAQPATRFHQRRSKRDTLRPVR